MTNNIHRLASHSVIPLSALLLLGIVVGCSSVRRNTLPEPTYPPPPDSIDYDLPSNLDPSEWIVGNGVGTSVDINEALNQANIAAINNAVMLAQMEGKSISDFEVSYNIIASQGRIENDVFFSNNSLFIDGVKIDDILVLKFESSQYGSMYSILLKIAVKCEFEESVEPKSINDPFGFRSAGEILQFAEEATESRGMIFRRFCEALGKNLHFRPDGTLVSRSSDLIPIGSIRELRPGDVLVDSSNRTIGVYAWAGIVLTGTGYRSKSEIDKLMVRSGYRYWEGGE